MKIFLALTTAALAVIPCGQAEARVQFSVTAEVHGAYAHRAYYEESLARDEETRIYQRPIGGRENRYWYDYRINITEAQKELDSDLARADDDDDARDAWREYARELRAERQHYADAMARRGLLNLGVFVGD